MRRKFASPFLIPIVLALSLTALQAQIKAADAQKDPWYQHAVFYEIYPRSFMDSNGDDVGDLSGIASKLDYLQALGVDAIWTRPASRHRKVDFGYDVSGCRRSPFAVHVAEVRKSEVRSQKEERGILHSDF
jgi:1,4-alpha-glucan branching enzyme